MRARPHSLQLVAAALAVLVPAACSAGPTTSPHLSATASRKASSSPAASTGITTPHAQKLVVDTDLAPDDLVALSFLLSAPGVEVVAITVSGTGEVQCPQGDAVALGLLERLGAPQIPVACGRDTPLAGDHAFPDAWREAADEGSALALPETARVPYNGTATALISRVAEEDPGLAVLTLGPLTNLAEALQADSSLAGRLGQVTVMGGALRVPGNILGPGAPSGNGVAEWNIYVDPHAAAVVVASGLQPRLVSLDGTSQVPVTTAFAQQVASKASAPGAKVLADLFATHPFMTDGTYYLWDPLAAELAAGYSVGTFSAATVTIEEADGPESGFTRPTDGPANVTYLSTADRASAEETLLTTLNGS